VDRKAVERRGEGHKQQAARENFCLAANVGKAKPQSKWIKIVEISVF